MPFTPFGTVYSLLVIFAFLLGQGKVFGASFLTYLSTRTYGADGAQPRAPLDRNYITQEQWFCHPRPVTRGPVGYS